MFQVFKSIYEDVHEYPEVLNDIITSVSVGVQPGRGCGVNIMIDIKGHSYRFKQITCKLIKNLSLTEFFVIKNEIICIGSQANIIFRARVEEWIEDVGMEVHSKPHQIIYFNNGLFRIST